MTVTVPEVRWIASARAPEKTQFETFEGGLGAELYLSGRGSVRADSEAVTITVADESSRPELAALADNWGRTLWLALNGVFSFHGTTMERDGFGLALLGDSRVGCSMTAMVLASEGWSLIADGECAVRTEDDSVVAVSTARDLEVDTAMTVMSTMRWPSEPRTSGRARSAIAIPRSPSTCSLSAIIELRLARSISSPAVVPAERSEVGAAGTLRECCSVGNAVLSQNPGMSDELDRFCEAVVDQVPSVVALIPEGKPEALFPPPEVASLVAEEVARIGGPSVERGGSAS